MKGVIRVSMLLVVTLCGNIACGSDTAGIGEGAGGDGSTPLPLIVSIAGAPDPEQILDGSAPIPNFGVEAVASPRLGIRGRGGLSPLWTCAGGSAIHVG